MSIEFFARVNEDGTIYLPEEYRYLLSHLVKIQIIEQEEEVRSKESSDSVVPVELMERYHELSDKRLRGELTESEVPELQQVEQEIQKIEESHPVLQLFEQQQEYRHRKMMESLEDISDKLKTLTESL